MLTHAAQKALAQSGDFSRHIRQRLFAHGQRIPVNTQPRLADLPRNDMKVHMLDFLPRSRSVVLEDVVAVGSCRFHDRSADSGQRPAEPSRRII